MNISSWKILYSKCFSNLDYLDSIHDLSNANFKFLHNWLGQGYQQQQQHLQQQQQHPEHYFDYSQTEQQQQQISFNDDMWKKW